MKQNRTKSLVAFLGTVLTIISGVAINLQANGVIEETTDSSSIIIVGISTVIGVIVGIYSHYNNPTSKTSY